MQRRTLFITAASAAVLALAACGSGFDDPDPAPTDGANTEPAPGAGDGGSLTVLIGSSGDAETEAVNAAVAAQRSLPPSLL